MEKSLVHKVLIAGTGRTGTSFLMAVLHDVGINIGFSDEEVLHTATRKSKAGLELEIGFIYDYIEMTNETPYIVKCPRYSHMIKSISEKCIIDHVYIPIREMEDVVKSRVSKKRNSGGLWGARDGNSQRVFLYKILGCLIHDLILLDIPYTFVKFDKMISDPKYCYNKFNFILNGISKKSFIISFNKMNKLFKGNVKL